MLWGCNGREPVAMRMTSPLSVSVAPSGIVTCTVRLGGGGPDLIWYGAAGNRTKPSITGFGILDGFRGVLVRDDYGGYLSYDDGLAGVQQCLAHLLQIP